MNRSETTSYAEKPASLGELRYPPFITKSDFCSLDGNASSAECQIMARDTQKPTAVQILCCYLPPFPKAKN